MSTVFVRLWAFPDTFCTSSEETEASRRNAREVIDRLQESAGVAEVELLKVAIEKSDELRTLRAEQAKTVEALRTERGGLSVV